MKKNNEISPKMKKDKVFLSGGHQIILILKGNKNWDEYYKNNKNHDKSWNKDGKKLEQFEKKHKIEFHYCNEDEGITYTPICPTLWQKIKHFINLMNFQLRY